MPVHVIHSKFFEFDQNNSGGHRDIDPAKGIGMLVIIEATSAKDAVARAEDIGLYFDGVENNMDCSCCGDRWYRPFDDGDDEIKTTSEAYVHYMDGRIEHINPRKES